MSAYFFFSHPTCNGFQFTLFTFSARSSPCDGLFGDAVPGAQEGPAPAVPCPAWAAASRRAGGSGDTYLGWHWESETLRAHWWVFNGNV